MPAMTTGIASRETVSHSCARSSSRKNTESSFPAYLPNPGTALPMHLVTRGVTARNAIYHDSRYPSAIELPVRGR